MMDASPEPTVVAQTLKDFNKFLCRGNKNRDSTLGSCGRLNFSETSSISDSGSVLEDDSRLLGSSRKRPLDTLAGFDIAKKFREKDVEIVGAQATITRLEGRVQELETSAKKARLERDMEVETLRRRQLRDKELIDDLQHKVKQLQSREREAQEAASKAKKECGDKTLDVEATMNKMQQSYLQRTNDLQEVIAGLQEKVLTLEREAEKQSSELKLAESQATDLEEQLAKAQTRLRESADSRLQSETLKLELDRAKAKIKELELRQEGLRSLEKQANVCESAVRRLPVLEKELAKVNEDNKFLRATALNTQLIEEKLLAAEHQVKLLEKRCEENAHFQAKLDLYKETCEQYEAVTREACGLEKQDTTPRQLQLYLAKLQQGDQALTNSIAQLRASHKLLEESRASEEEQLRMLKAKLEKQHQNNQQNAQLIKRLQRKLILVSREREGLKDIMSSYESEVTINHSVVSQERIVLLEQQLEMYRQEMQNLEKELEQTRKPLGEDTVTTTEEPRREDAEKIASLEKKVLDLESDIVKLNQEKDVLELRLEHRALKGDFDPTKTKILHFENNPLSKAIEHRGTENERLQKENEALRERVRLLEEGEAHDITQKVGVKVTREPHSSREMSELQERVSSLETRNKRLLEVFKRRSLDMREVVYRLTGYRVDVLQNNQYKLINMYADSADDYFVFEQTPNKDLQMLETGFSCSMEDLIDTHLRHENSYPAFLSAVTLDLFNKQTILHPVSSSNEEEDEDEEEEEEEEEEKGRKKRPQQHHDDNDDLVILD